MNRISRRDAISTLALTSAGLITGCATAPLAPALVPPAGAPAMTTPVSLAGNHQPIPLPFAPTALNGISEKLIKSHHENNYVGAVKNLNRTELELTKINAETPPFVVAALRDKELTFRNSKTLHEAYFANLGGDGKRAGGIEAAIATAYGSSARWEEHFRMTGAGLGGGSGWVVLALELETGALRTVGAGNHTQSLATSAPLLVMDMYEHAYQMDFGAAAAKYIETFFTNIHWEEVNRRFERANRASTALRGVTA